MPAPCTRNVPSRTTTTLSLWHLTCCAHRQLDAAVDKAFGLRGSVTGDALLRALFASYQQLTTTDELTIPVKKSQRRAVQEAR